MRFFLIILLFIAGTGFAQQPSHIKVGETDFADTEIYDLIQNNDNNLLIATGKGLYQYDAYTISQLKGPPEMMGSSLFRFEKDQQGNVYCCNLYGQVFKIEQESFKLIYQIPDSILSQNFKYHISNDNELVVLGKKIMVIDRGGNSKVIFNHRVEGEIYRDNEGVVWIHYLAQNQLLSYSNRALEVTPLDSSFGYEATNRTPYFFALINQKAALYKRSDSTAYFLENAKEVEKIKLNDAPRKLYQLADGEVWASSSKNGVYVYNDELNSHYGGKQLFGTNYISAIYQDHEGSIILGTFGNGLLWIKNKNLIDFPVFQGLETVSKVTGNGTEGVAIGTSNGGIYTINKQLQPQLLQQEKSRILALESLEEANTLIYHSEFQPILHHLKSGVQKTLLISAVKDVQKISDVDYIISSSSGSIMYSANVEKSKFNHAQNPFLNNNTKGVGLSGRTFSGNYDAKNNQLLIGTANGLQVCDVAGNCKSLTYKEEVLICRDLEWKENKMYIATQKHGVLIYENGKFTDSISTANGLFSLQIKQLQFHNNQLFISNASAFQVWDIVTSEMITFGKSEGLYTAVVEDFVIAAGSVWVVTQKGLQTISLEAFKSNNDVPELSLTRLNVNDQQQNLKAGQIFKYNENKIQFEVKCNTFKHKEEITYKYRLKGLDEAWQYNAFDANKIDYKSLPPGKYQFVILPVYKGKEGKAIVYKFEIEPPFWQTWLFFISLTIGFLVLSFFLYRYYVRRQLKKVRLLNELNASKLTAIQSQMNPHFIFNSLNSIQDLVLKGDSENSYTYITKFANLVRRTLNYSDKDFIDFEQEVKLIELYLMLEKLRFKSNFEYEIEYENWEGIQVPPMLIQPFIENALVHGLLHREGLKKIQIKFELSETLVCTITDNGIGRTRAKEIKKRQRSEHESFSVNAIQKRFEILKQHFKGNFGFEYRDLEEDGKPIGTQVILNIPVNKIL
jgi:ligand-binding sensor domain-containing protein